MVSQSSDEIRHHDTKTFAFLSYHKLTLPALLSCLVIIGLKSSLKNITVIFLTSLNGNGTSLEKALAASGVGAWSGCKKPT